MVAGVIGEDVVKHVGVASGEGPVRDLNVGEPLHKDATRIHVSRTWSAGIYFFGAFCNFKTVDLVPK